MIHIASEIVVVIGLTFYFNQKNKKLMSHIEDLSQRIEEQEDLLQKHEQVIRKLVDFINLYQSEAIQSQSNYRSPPQQEQTKNKKIEIKTKSNVTKPVLSKPEPTVVTKPVLSKPEPKVTFNEVITAHPLKLSSSREDEEEEEEDDSDLDAELSEELKELVSSDPVQIIKVDTGLKKRSR